MSDLLSIGSSGVTAYQRALATVSNNIANVNTEGYTRQDVSLNSNEPREIGGGFIGTGARFDQVRRQYDAFVESNLRNSNSELQSQEPLLSYVNRLIDVMGDQSIGLTTAMNLFFESSRNLASDPASTVQRSIFLRDADGLAARFRQLSTQFELLNNETQQAVETDIGQVNSITQQLAQLNKQFAKKSSASSQPSELLDQRDLLLRNLSGLIAVKTKFAENGSVLVSVGDTLDQGILVRDNTSRAISVQASATDPSKLQFQIDPYGNPEGLPAVGSGKIGGVMTFREQVLAPAIDALDNLAQAMVTQVNTIHKDGVDAEGLLGTDLFGFSADQAGQAGGMQLLIQDTSRVAAAGQFRVIDDPLNPGTAQARVQYDTPQYAGPTALIGDLANAQVPRSATVKVGLPSAQGFASLGLVKAGTQDLVLTLNSPNATQNLQVFTRDGRHLLGSDLTASADGNKIVDRMLKSANGMEEGAQYSDAMLNAGKSTTNGQTVDSRYLDMDLFMGVKASVQYIQQFNPSTGALLDPKATPALMQGRAVSGNGWLTAIGQSGRFTLDGVTLTPPNPALTSNDPQGLANWINGQGIAGVKASIVNGGLQLSRTDTLQDIRLGLGPNGTPADLSALGFDTSVYVSGTAQDDLLVFVTDTAATATLDQATVTAEFKDIDGDIKQMLRAQSLQVTFTANNRYEIRDTRSDTLLAERLLDTQAAPVIHYRGLTLEFTTQPSQGDKFRIDGNQDGIGNNEAMLKLVALEEKKVMPGGLTMTEAYIERVNLVGNVARQAAISKQALTVVYEQAQEARDGTSGVSLDEEASALVRFQQAYQANAKVMQIASQLFDAILQVR